MTLLADGSIEGRWGVSGVDHAFADEFGTRTRYGKGGLRLGMARAGLQAGEIIGALFYQKAAQYRKCRPVAHPGQPYAQECGQTFRPASAIPL